MTDAELERHFRHFAQVCSGSSPLYAALSTAVAEHPQVMRLADGGQDRQPPPNLLFGAVHYLLLGGARHPLAEFYPSVGDRRIEGTERAKAASQAGAASDAEATSRAGAASAAEAAARAWPAFAGFCETFKREITELVATKRVQTNEVGRCGLLLPAFRLAFDLLGGRPLHLIDVGASAGLNLQFDRYRYEYRRAAAETAALSNGELLGTCGPPSPAVIRTALIESSPSPDEPASQPVEHDPEMPSEPPPPFAVPDAMPLVADRVGVDVSPVDVRDEPAVRWIESMIWADQVERIELFRAAVAIARRSPPRIVRGSAMERVPELVQAAAPGSVPCVFHSHAIYQMPREWRERFEAMLTDLSRQRDLAHVSLEWLGDDPGPRLHLSLCTAGRRRKLHLADAHHHGKWMRWQTTRSRPTPR